MFLFLFFFMEMVLNSQKDKTNKTQQRPRKPKLVFNFLSLNRFFTTLPANTRHHSPLGPLILPACFGLVCSKLAMEAERESERDRQCAVLTSEEALTAVARGGRARRCVKLGLQKGGGEAERCPPATPKYQPGRPACMACARKAKQAENPGGDQRLSTTLQRL